MTIGGRIASVFGGVADRERFQLYKPVPRTETRASDPDAALMQQYQALAEWHARGSRVDAQACAALLGAFDAYPEEWLLRAEALRLAPSCLPADLRLRATQDLERRADDPAQRQALSLVFPDEFPLAS